MGGLKVSVDTWMIIYHHQPTSVGSFPKDVQVQIHGVLLLFLPEFLLIHALIFTQRHTDMYFEKEKKKTKLLKYSETLQAYSQAPCSLQANPESLKFNMFEGSRCCWIPSAWNIRPGSRYGKNT